MKTEKEVKDAIKKLDKEYLDLFKRGSVHWTALDRIALLRWFIDQKTLSKAEKSYKAWGKQISQIVERKKHEKAQSRKTGLE